MGTTTIALPVCQVQTTCFSRPCCHIRTGVSLQPNKRSVGNWQTVQNVGIKGTKLHVYIWILGLLKVVYVGYLEIIEVLYSSMLGLTV